MIKAIETHYNGYRFRSRLEARWAVFFDTLGIKYEYEKEGYDLDGVWYLPDFWLPELDCWIEIKGELPSCEEVSKAFWLSWLSGKHVYILSGSENLSGKASTIMGLGEVAFRMKLKDSESTREGELTTLKRICDESSFDPLAKGFRCVEHVMADISNWMIAESRTDGVKEGDLEVLLIAGKLAWTECPLCQKVAITYLGLPSEMGCHCIDNFPDAWKERSNCQAPRMMLAYEAARQARFEHGKKG